MPQEPDSVFFNDIHIGIPCRDQEGCRNHVAPQPFTPPKLIDLSGPGRLVTPAA